MKVEVDIFCTSNIEKIIKRIKTNQIEVIVYDAWLKKLVFCNSKVIKDLALFNMETCVIMENLTKDDILDVVRKLYSLDLFEKTNKLKYANHCDFDQICNRE